MDLRGRDVVVLGTGQTGLSLVRWLTRRHARVRVADTRDDPPNARTLADGFPKLRIDAGPLSASNFIGADMIAISPGVAKDQPPIAEAVASGVELVGDIELFARSMPRNQRVLAVTGTNGKTTVSALTGELVGAAGMTAIVAGNIGNAVLDVHAQCEHEDSWPDVFVLELSSYQLETTRSLKPLAATVLNVSPNHLDRYDGVADYAAAKGTIFTHAAVQVLNRDDPIVRLMRLPGRTVQTFGHSVPVSGEEWGLVSRPDGEWLARGGELLASASSLTLVGRHNVQNALAALALTSSIAEPTAPIITALAKFGGLPHRMQRIADAHGVLFVNDSKATTVAATDAALQGIDRPVVLIAGGDGKGQSYRTLKSAVDRTCKAVLLIGRDAPSVARGIAGTRAIVETLGTLDAAVARAFELAQRGDAVLLSPASASLDQFTSYVERGDRFTAQVRGRLQDDARCASA
ncbi:MAG TPA: UDP-N-acetylmuramoyl-L-alanine--D-glutamate ligase [Casimicrobiaceae bacterium]|nr:UDP-N-acetylmuramoyl-L-alanine--D-glutamate ligase [Casimicrobiaceae bacterium]